MYLSRKNAFVVLEKVIHIKDHIIEGNTIQLFVQMITIIQYELVINLQSVHVAWLPTLFDECGMHKSSGKAVQSSVPEILSRTKHSVLVEEDSYFSVLLTAQSESDS